ncbi:MAG: hypothetical protein B6D64_08075 [Bacteroidetes bacterium 4484_276]|nr:MAG: hypothetical protein B6D64_08075 [Bacteroidetes bacterium 4484_276]
MKELTFETREDFRHWLDDNHQSSQGVWVVYFKKHTKTQSISYNEAVEEALCFGWIDSKVRTIDELRYKQVFTPRNPKSMWSELNKQRIAKMMGAGKMKPAGLKAVTEAKKNGQWEKSYKDKNPPQIPDDLKTALMKNPSAWENFNNFAPSYRGTYIIWVVIAKRTETRENRIKKVVENALKNVKPGMM